MWIPRRLEPRLCQLAASRPVVVLTGARQTGKTALCRHLFPDHRYVSLICPVRRPRRRAIRRPSWPAIQSL